MNACMHVRNVRSRQSSAVLVRTSPGAVASGCSCTASDRPQAIDRTGLAPRTSFSRAGIRTSLDSIRTTGSFFQSISHATPTIMVRASTLTMSLISTSPASSQITPSSNFSPRRAVDPYFCSQQQEMLEIVIPEGVKPGEKLGTVTPQGVKVTITVPEGAAPGTILQFVAPPPPALS